MVKICGISDLHGTLPEIGQCDVVCICGDLFPLEIQRINTECEAWINSDFTKWVEGLPCDKVIIIAGNHDFLFERIGATKTFQLFNNNPVLKNKIIYLQDDSCIYKGLIIYGCPWCTGPRGWAFVEPTGKHYLNIPDCDILLTHQPPRVNKVGCSYPGTAWEENWGSEVLKDEIKQHKIRYNLCGHIHTGTHDGDALIGYKTIFYNVSIKDEDYIPNFKPTYFEIENDNDNN